MFKRTREYTAGLETLSSTAPPHSVLPMVWRHLESQIGFARRHIDSWTYSISHILSFYAVRPNLSELRPRASDLPSISSAIRSQSQSDPQTPGHL